MTLSMIRRGRSSAFTKSSTLSHPVNGPSSPYSLVNSVILAVVRLCTAVGVPRRAMLRARLAPITASPVTPIRLCPVAWLIGLPLWARGALRGALDAAHVTDPGGGRARVAPGACRTPGDQVPASAGLRSPGAGHCGAAGRLYGVTT